MMSISIAKQAVLMALGAVLITGSSLAHHSFALFDRTNDTIVKGTVVRFQWTNPHCYLDVVAGDGATTWTLETAGTNTLIRRGYKKEMFKVGDLVTLHLSPLRSGAPGGLLMSAQKADGTVYKFNDEPTS